MSMNPIFKFVVAALLLTGSAAGALVPALNDQPAATPAAEMVAETTAELTAAEAAAIALTDAGLTEADVTRLKTHREPDDGVPEWEVDFRHGDWEYDYTIHAQTGVILERDKEYEPPKTVTQPTPTEPAPTEAPVTEPVVTEPVVTEPAYLTAEEALAIALAHAGLTAEEVSALRTEKDLDDGVPQWEVDFRHGDWEYDYDIHAETGHIRTWDKEYDPVEKSKPTEPPATEPAPTEAPATEPAATMLTAQEAETIALAHAGLTAEEVVFDKTELDHDDGVAEYEVEFYVGNWEYSYEIDALTGKILEWEKEFDD